MPVRSSSPRALVVISILAALAAAATAAPIAAPKDHGTVDRIDLPRSVRVRVAGRVTSVPLEEYVLASALTEVSPVGESPAAVARIFEVQAVLARTYAVSKRKRHGDDGFDLCDETHCQLYEPARIATSRFATTARTAVRATRGQVLAFGSRVARVLFHADCGGHTIAADAVWRGAPLSYLVGAPDEAPDVSHRAWMFDAPVEALRLALNADGRSAVGAKLLSMVVTARDPSGRATAVQVQGARRANLGGEQFRTVVNAAFGPKAIQSTRFDVTATRAGYRFDGTGYGHGVGLCQVGAAARARRGASLADIFAAYFPGARLTS